MNSKKAKALRAFVRTLPLPEKQYAAYSPPVFKQFKLTDPATKAVLGHQWMKVHKGIPRVLSKCQREVYQKAKRGRV